MHRGEETHGKQHEVGLSSNLRDLFHAGIDANAMSFSPSPFSR
jgi:hypothetical protein